jgi:Ca2+-binding EF-hand superfamily protein
MSFSSFTTLVLLALPLAPLTTDSALASEGDQARSSQSEAARFRAMDMDNDGRVTREEWRGSVQSFRVHDWNRDGVLSGDELRPGGWRNGRGQVPDFDAEASGEINDWSTEAFANLDHNRDGRIARTEWHYDLDTFRRVDSNRDNTISRAEFLGNADIDDDRGDRFEFLDANNDGRLERYEWHGTRNAFDALDQNRDGVLSRREVAGEPVAPTETDQFVSLDYNRNGTITPDEWHWSLRTFDQRDLNRDGRLTRKEFIATADATTASNPVDSAVTSRVVRVDARERWTDTGIFVPAGAVVEIDAEGQVQMSPDGNDIASPAGSRTGRLAPNAPVRDQSAGGLVARIGNDAPRFVGQHGSVSSRVSGQLYLTVNDDHLADNNGEFRATIRIRE